MNWSPAFEGPLSVPEVSIYKTQLNSNKFSVVTGFCCSTKNYATSASRCHHGSKAETLRTNMKTTTDISKKEQA